MKKNKFLSIAVMAAFMALGLSSCEKENFRYENINVEINAAPAKVEFQPTVILVMNGVATNVTNEIEPEYSSLPTAGEDGTIAAQDVTVTVSHTVTDAEYGISTTLTESETVSIPALNRGQIYTATPTIILNAQTTTSIEKVEGTESTHTIPSETIALKNKSNFYYTDAKATYTYKTGNEVLQESINWLETSYQNDPEVMALIDAYNKFEEGTETVENVTVYAKSQTIITVTFEATKTKYTINKKVVLGDTTKDIPVVEFEVIAYGSHAPYWGEDSANIHLDGIEHGHGHGHGHGHSHAGNDNAGGGIWQE